VLKPVIRALAEYPPRPYETSLADPSVCLFYAQNRLEARIITSLPHQYRSARIS